MDLRSNVRLFRTEACFRLTVSVTPFLLLILACSQARVETKDSPTPRSALVQERSSEQQPVTQTQSINGEVVGITDGDTITILDDKKTKHTIRLAGIDAPENGQDFANKAKANLSALVFGRTVTAVGDKIDRYDRRVAKVIVDGSDVGLEQIRAGFAWHFKNYEDEQSPDDRKAYSDAELPARKSKLNIWSMPNPIAPWDFRSRVAVEPGLKGKIIGNRNSGIYHWEGCPGFSKVAEQNRVLFSTPAEAEREGFRAARNCSTPPPVDGDGVTTESQSNPVPLKSTTTPEVQTESRYVRGPRGGCYYFNGSGRKVYVDRGLCDKGITSDSTRNPSSPKKTYNDNADSGYIRGPRGGCYYVSSSGRKVCVDRSRCR